MKNDAVVRIARARELAASGEAREIRLSCDLPIGEVAKAIPVPTSTVWRWENGKQLPRGDRALRYLEVLDALSLMRAGRSSVKQHIGSAVSDAAGAA